MRVNLRRMRFLMNRIPAALFRVEKARSNAEKITQTISDMPHGSDMHSKVEDGAITIEHALEAYDAVISELTDMRKELMPYIKRLEDPNERAAIKLMYIDGYRTLAISNAIFHCERQVRRYIEKGEKHLEEMFD